MFTSDYWKEQITLHLFALYVLGLK